MLCFSELSLQHGSLLTQTGQFQDTELANIASIPAVVSSDIKNESSKLTINNPQHTVPAKKLKYYTEFFLLHPFSIFHPGKISIFDP